MIVAVSILANGWSPAVSMTWRKMFSRCLRVAAARAAHAVVSR
jgi:hypothetical protein